MKDAKGTVIYVGKAASLKKRVSSYFKPKAALDTKTRILVENIANFDYLLTASEAEALLLEHSLITQYKPKYNISLKDDKRYPLIKVTINEKSPRILIARRRKNDGAIYYGRYTNATLLRQALAIMRQLFPLRTCRTMPKTACLNYHIGQCIGPCIGKCSKKEYDQVVKEVRLFLEGKKQKLIGELTKRMQAASASRNYETAAKLRDRIQALSVIARSHPAPHIRCGEFPTSDVGSGGTKSRQSLDELRLALGLGKTPLRIEAFDVSNIFGHEAVGSMVSFFDMPTTGECLSPSFFSACLATDTWPLPPSIIIRSGSFRPSRKMRLYRRVTISSIMR